MMLQTANPAAIGKTVPSNDLPTRPPAKAPIAVLSEPITEEAIPALCPCGSIAMALKFGAMSPNRKNAEKTRAANTARFATPHCRRGQQNERHGRKSGERRMRNAAHSKPPNQARIDERGDGHRRCDGAEYDRERLTQMKDFDENLLGARDIGQQTSEHEAAGNAVGHRQRIEDGSEESVPHIQGAFGAKRLLGSFRQP